MPFLKVPYLEWAHLKPGAKYNLSGSSVGVTEPEDLEFRWEGTRFTGPNQYGYVPLLESIARRYGVRPANVATACGTSMANFLVCATLIEPGDEVVVERPCYGPLLDLPQALGARIKRLDRRFQNGYQIDVEELRRLAGRRTRLIILTDLHNPSGIKLPLETLREIGDIAKTIGARVLIDEVYLDFCFNENTPSAVRISDRFISTNSLTKVYGLDGLRCGWILADEKTVRRIWRVRDYVDGNGPFPTEFASCRLFDKLPRILQRSHDLVRNNFPLVRSFVESRPELKWIPPDGGVICFPRHRNAAELPARLNRLLQDFDTLVVPGRFFESRSHFRLGFGIPQETLKAGLENMSRAFDASWRAMAPVPARSRAAKNPR